jgi:hypothetical protein
MVFEEHLKHSVMKSTFQKLFANHVDHNMSREVVYIYLVKAQVIIIL